MLCVTFHPDRNPALNILYNFNLQNRVTYIQTNKIFRNYSTA